MGKHSAHKGSAFGEDPKRGASRRPLKRAASSASSVSSRASQGARRVATEDPQYALPDSRSRKRGPLEAAPERLRQEAGRRKQRAKRIAAIIAGSLVGVLVLGAIGLFAYAKYLEGTMHNTIFKQDKLKLDLKAAAPQQPYNLLLVGFDRRPGETVFRTDSMMLARIDPKTKQVWMLSIPRDTKVLIPGYGTHKINQAFALGKTQLAIKVVEDFTGEPVNHFMAVNFTGFEKAVDAMGGVWVNVPTEINDKKADRSPNHRAAHVDAGVQLLDGEHALTFVRSRAYADADITRMKNQQTFFKAFADQVATKTTITSLPRIVSSIAPYISTDMSLMDMLKTAQALRGAGSKRVYTATLSGEWVSPYLITDEANKAALLKKFEDGVPFEKSKSVTSTAESAAVSKKKPAQITVAIRNGAGIAGCAKQAAAILKAKAFKVGEVGNAGQFVYDKTLVVYKDDEGAAELVASTLPPGCKVVESRGMYSFTGDVLVVIGKDWDVSKIPVAQVETQ